MAGSLLVFKNGQEKEEKRERHWERERGEHTIVIIMCVQ